MRGHKNYSKFFRKCSLQNGKSSTGSVISLGEGILLLLPAMADEALEGCW